MSGKNQSSPEIMTFGKYTLTLHQEGWYWLTKEDGEGMGIYPEELERMLDKHFKENF